MKNLGAQVKSCIPDAKAIISDDEILAINKINRYIGEISVAEGFLGLFNQRFDLRIQDYEFYTNLPTLSELLFMRMNSVHVRNHSDSTFYWSIAFSILRMKEAPSIFYVNEAKHQEIKPVSTFSAQIMRNLFDSVNNGTKPDVQPKVHFIDATENIKWNILLEELHSAPYEVAIIARNYMSKGVFDETKTPQGPNIKTVLSLVGYAFLSNF